jgi:glycosyltransferase involved in cell wall biosynthesis
MYPEGQQPSFGGFVKTLNAHLAQEGVEVEVLRRGDGARGIVSYADMAMRGVASLARGRRHDLVHLHYIGGAAPIAMSLAKLYGCPLIATAHGSDIEAAQSSVKRELIRTFLESCDGIHYVSEPLRKRATQLLGDFEKPTLIQNTGIDLNLFVPGSPPSFEPLRLVVLGNLVLDKGWDAALGAVSELKVLYPGVELHAYGAGDGEWLSALAKNHGVSDRVTFHGTIPLEELPGVYHGASVVLVPSRREGFGLVGLEAMASGALVVTTAAGGMAEYASNEKNCLVVDVDDPGQITAAVRRLVEDETLRGSLRDGAIVTATKFSAHAAARRIAEFYKQVVS